MRTIPSPWPSMMLMSRPLNASSLCSETGLPLSVTLNTKATLPSCVHTCRMQDSASQAEYTPQQFTGCLGKNSEVWKAYRSRPNITVISTQQVCHFGQQASLVLSSQLEHRGFHPIVVICLVYIGTPYSATLHIIILTCCMQPY